MDLITERPIGNAVVRVLRGDLTLSEADAIVNAANSYLKHGGGVAAAIVRRGGRVIQDESDRAGFVPEGQVYLTSGGALSARYVIHAVGPRGGDPQGDEKLESAVREAMLAAEEKGLRSIAFPAISSGIFGFPKDRCAQILVSTVLQYLENHQQGAVVQADFVLFDDETTSYFHDALVSSR